VCFAPFVAIPVLYLIAMSAILWLFVQIFVLLCQGVLKLAGIAIKKGEVYWKNRQAEKTEQLLLTEPIEEPKP
jgi:hypothetical protein